MALDPRLVAVLACPVDKGPLYYLGDEGGLYNPRLRRRYHLRGLTNSRGGARLACVRACRSAGCGRSRRVVLA